MLPSVGPETHRQNNATKSILLLVGMPVIVPLVFFVVLYLAMAATESARQPNPFGIFNVAFFNSLLVFAVVLAIVAVWYPIAWQANRWIVGRATDSVALTPEQGGGVWQMLDTLAVTSGMRTPELRLVETDALNAFACGVKEGEYSVGVTRGLVDALDDRELAAVLAHELTHIRNGDARLMIVATVVAGVAPMFLGAAGWLMKAGFRTPGGAPASMPSDNAGMIFFFMRLTLKIGMLGLGVIGWITGLIGDLISVIMRLALSRRREFMADAGAVELTQDPEAMIAALRKIDGRSEMRVGIPALSEMLFEHRAGGLGDLFSTHPSIEARIAAIQQTYGRG